ncbi:dynactin subunit 4-like [Tubulanus polymorphus]|uniref:dynactin subunit 4-like n=1 Tax=Tubulanus polymorphus TaxID=672921 RepID=UPI003DA44F07
MATFGSNLERVLYSCFCGKKNAICRLYFCRHCLKLRCSDCVSHEVDTPFCPNCLECMPTTEAKLKKNRCTSCFDCPSCQHTLSTRATTMPVPNPEDPNKSLLKKVYYLACGFCRWTSRDASLQDQPVATGGWKDQENPHFKRLSTLYEYYRQMAQKEKVEKERRKYSRRRSYLHLSHQQQLETVDCSDLTTENLENTMDKYGLTPTASRKRGLISMASLSLKESEDIKIQAIEVSYSSTDVMPLDESVYTQPLILENVTTISQRLASPEFQPETTSNLYPIHKHLLIKRSLRCRECEHNLSKPEYSPVSIKFKIQLIALYFVPDIKIMTMPHFQFQKESRVVLTMVNPSDYMGKVTFRPLDQPDWSETALVSCPDEEILLSPRDDTAVFDDGTTSQKEFKDNPDTILFRKANKVGFFVKVTPQKALGDIKISFMIRYNHHNMVNPIPAKDAEVPIEPVVTWMEHPVYINLGPLSTSPIS